MSRSPRFHLRPLGGSDLDEHATMLHASVCEDGGGGVDGFTISGRHPALAVMGRCVARFEEAAIAMVRRGREQLRGTGVLLLVPMEKRKMVAQFCRLGAVNVETHFEQVWGRLHPFRDVNMSGFLPESG